ncbi:sodium/sulphate symporter [Desulfitobacterium hafniense DCB-2]|uniref:Sodium/sulphate symporter n=1 Tax=Desulfitobacterium hafniense (strain DSM 10664 / DCB-2) TaxID=272564 RepID=B8FXJ8_DESHD|nr:SLC13 family permease [Desulfitobacterium hafniense]ACL22599.1 sodium/sulphate symporter [Desulfitobacterium hafniense DCB-2]
MSAHKRETREKSWKNILYYLNSLIVIALIFGGWYFPVIEPLTPLGMRIIGIFAGVIYAWSTVGILWPALLGLIALGLTGYTTVPEAFQMGYGGDAFLFVFFILIFAAMVDKAGITEVIANWVVSRRFASGKPWMLTLLILTAAYVVAALVSVTPAIIICWGILYKLCRVFGFTKKDHYPKLMIVGIVFAGLMGHAALPYKMMAVILTGVFTKQTGLQIDFMSFTILAAAIGYFAVLGYIGLCRFVFRPDVTLIAQSKFVYANTFKLNTYQKQVITLLGVLIILLFLPGILPADLGLTQFLKRLGNTGIVVLLLAFVAFLRKKNSVEFVNFVELIREGIPWQSLFLLGTALPLAEAMTSEETGVKEVFMQLFSPLLNAHLSPEVFVFLFIGVSVLMTVFMGDIIVGLILVPLVCTYAPVVGISPEMLTVALCVSCLMGIVFPASSPLAALMHGNSEWVCSREIYKYTVSLAIVAPAIGALVCLILGPLLF